MILVGEGQVEELADYASLIAAMDEVFIACARGQVENYPFVRSHLKGGQDLFGVKSGCNYATGDLGLKAGGYWSGNAENGIDRHQSTVLLIDIETGRPRALVAGNNLTALRTAAAGAAAARQLARPEASRVAILGTGRQALFQLKALCEVRALESIVAWGRSPARLPSLAFAFPPSPSTSKSSGARCARSALSSPPPGTRARRCGTPISLSLSHRRPSRSFMTLMTSCPERTSTPWARTRGESGSCLPI